MKSIFGIIVILISTSSFASESCLFPPCLPAPTAKEKQAAELIFKNAKYILGASFDIQNNNNRSTYENIPDFVQKTKTLKEDIKSLGKQAEELHTQLNGFQLKVAISNIELCIAYNQSAIQYCHQALTELKNYHWEQSFGTSWSGFPITQKWSGFPKSLK